MADCWLYAGDDLKDSARKTDDFQASFVVNSLDVDCTMQTWAGSWIVKVLGMCFNCIGTTAVSDQKMHTVQVIFI